MVLITSTIEYIIIIYKIVMIIIIHILDMAFW